ncbi:MAG: histidinol-phosphatase HisJ family protein [Clostridia bacterium]|nr:histidinol-phosphatase HisJ family protein [Clostridia bacterium]
MNYPSCIHTHTPYCDGKSTMREMILRAIALGYESLGFSPHSVLPYENGWALTEESYKAYREEFSRLREEFGDRIGLYAGIELDADTPVCPGGLDYVIGAVHSLEKNGERFAVDYRRDLFADVARRLYGGDFYALCRDYFAAYAEMALRPEVTVAAHFDLVTKYNGDGCFFDENDPRFLSPAFEAADRILEKRGGMIFEINTGGMARAGRPCPYPAPPILRYLHERGASFIITCDCHSAPLLGVGYDCALSLLRALDRPRLLIFRGGRFVPFC